MLQTATKANVDWDPRNKHWHLRIQVGEEVIKRKLDSATEDTDAQTLKSQAVACAKDEGYDVDPATIVITK